MYKIFLYNEYHELITIVVLESRPIHVHYIMDIYKARQANCYHCGCLIFQMFK